MDSDSPLHNVIGTDLAKICDFFLSVLSSEKEKWIRGEMVICSAVKFGDVIVRGHRHCDCITTAQRMRIDTKHVSGDEGFMTSKNRFVGRKEAFEIQKLAGIKSVDQYGGSSTEELYSEDLY